MRTNVSQNPGRGASIVETVMALTIAGVAVSGTVSGYLLSSNRAEWSAYSLAAHSLAMQRLEQVRAAKWDTQPLQPVDLVIESEFPPQVSVLDVPISGTNVVYATNFTTISSISTKPMLKMIQVDCVWSFMGKRTHTNTVFTYRAPDQ